MLKITDNIFSTLNGQLEFLGREGDCESVPSACGVIIPDTADLEFSNECSSLPIATNALETAAVASWFLFVIDSAWQTDSPRMRHLGLKPSLNNDADWTTQIAASIVLSELEGRIRHCGLVMTKAKLLSKALGFIGKHQRSAFLVGDLNGEYNPHKLLQVLHREGTQNVLHSQRLPFFDWVRLVKSNSISGIVFITAFGWAEEHCDFRYLALGERPALESLLNPDSPSSTPRG